MSTAPVITSRGRDTVASVLRAQVAERAEDVFCAFEVEPGRIQRITWSDQWQRSVAAARTLHRLGIRPGHRLGVHLTNCPEFFDAWLAAALLGAAIVPSNPLSTADELGYQIGHAGCRVVVTQEDLLPVVREAASGGVAVVRVEDGWDDADTPAGATAWSPAEPGEPGDPQPTDVLGVLYTSGTTSRPKGVLITHAAYLHVGDVVAEHLRLRPEDRQLIVLPLFHGNAQYYSTMSALVTGASIALAPRFSASRWSEQAATLGATVASLFAAPIRMILAQRPSEHDAAHRVRATLFAQNVTDEQVRDFEARFATPLLQLYGMTETVAPPTMMPLYGEHRDQSMGRPTTGARLRLVDSDGKDVPTGEPGELWVAGEPGRTLMAGYLDNPEATAETLQDGWLRTGDTVRADADGYLYFVDRRKDMIKRAGENVATGEVERVINEHPAVFESAAFGVPDPVRDEAILVAVVLREGFPCTSGELLDYCRERLAKFKVPDRIEFVDALPRTSVGKIQKHLLRQQAVAAITEEGEPHR